jgi:protocatechuate 3,4-dioxygenase, alpha subunit
MILPPTASQTAGPYLAIGMVWAATARTVEPSVPGALQLSGALRDGAGEPVTDAALEFWHADAAGRVGGGAGCFTRALTDPAGRYAITTCKPGRVDAVEAPHISVSIFARGLQQRLVTHCYFADEAEANAADPTLGAVPSERRGRLLAAPVPGGYRFDIVLQGEEETPFFVP